MRYSPRTGRGRGASRLVHCCPFDHLRKRCNRRVLRRILDHRRTVFCLWTKLFLSVFKTCCASIQNFLRWKRKFPTLEIEISYVGNSFFLGRVWRRQMAALPFPVPHSPFRVPRACQRAVRMRGNRAPVAARAICASMRTLDVYLYAFGAQSCANRLDLLRSARLRPRF